MHLPLAHYKAIFHSTASKIHEISWSTEKFDLFLQTLWRGTMAINDDEEFSTTQFELLIFFEVRNEHLSGPHVLPCKLVRFGGESIVSMISNKLPLGLIGRYLSNYLDTNHIVLCFILLKWGVALLVPDKMLVHFDSSKKHFRMAKRPSFSSETSTATEG